MQKIAKNAKNAAFFYKECKRTQRTPNSFIKNPNERRSKIVIFIIENFEVVGFVLLCKRKLHADFHNKFYYLDPLKIWILTFKIIPDLCISAVFCQTPKKITPP